MDQFSKICKNHLENSAQSDLPERIVYDVVKDGNVIIQAIERWEIPALNVGETLSTRTTTAIAKHPKYFEWTII